jgi:hypothetical protein
LRLFLRLNGSVFCSPFFCPLPRGGFAKDDQKATLRARLRKGEGFNRELLGRGHGHCQCTCNFAMQQSKVCPVNPVLAVRSACPTVSSSLLFAPCCCVWQGFPTYYYYYYKKNFWLRRTNHCLGPRVWRSISTSNTARMRGVAGSPGWQSTDGHHMIRQFQVSGGQ